MDQPPPRSWWARNWIWAVPVGCLVTPVFCCGGGLVVFFTVVFGALKSSDAYAEAVQKAQADGRVKALLGEPVAAGFWVSGKITLNGPAGSAELAIPLSGPRGAATLHVLATKAGGPWQYQRLEVMPAGAGAPIDLRAGPAIVE